MKKVAALVKDTFRDFSDDKCSRMAAALSYYMVFSLPPLLIIILAIIGFFVDPADAQGRFVQQLNGLVGPQGAEAMRTMIEQANRPQGGIMAVVGVVTLLLQILCFRFTDIFLRGLPRRIAEGDVAAAVFLMSMKIALAVIIAGAIADPNMALLG